MSVIIILTFANIPGTSHVYSYLPPRYSDLKQERQIPLLSFTLYILLGSFVWVFSCLFIDPGSVFLFCFIQMHKYCIFQASNISCYSMRKVIDSRYVILLSGMSKALGKGSPEQSTGLFYGIVPSQFKIC